MIISPAIRIPVLMVSIYLSTYIWSAVVTIDVQEYLAEFSNIPLGLSTSSICFLIGLNTLVSIYVLFVYNKLQFVDRGTQQKKLNYFTADVDKLLISYLLILVIVLAADKLFFIKNLPLFDLLIKLSSYFNPGMLFPFYFFSKRSSLNKISILNLFLITINQLLLGWTSILFNIVFCELAYRSRSISWKRFLYGSIAILLSIFFIVPLSYPFVFNMKSSFRGEDKYLSQDIAKNYLLTRLNTFTAQALSIQINDSLADDYKDQRIYNGINELVAPSKPLMPGALVGEKSFNSFNSLLKQHYYPGNTTSTNLGVAVYLFLLFTVNPFLSFVVLALIAGALFFFLRLMQRYLFQVPHSGTFCFFLVLFNLLNFSSLENFIGRSYITFFILWFPLLSTYKIILKKFPRKVL